MATAASVSIPKFALPLKYVNGSALVNEQDSLDDIAACVYSICKTDPGDRDELPDFGLLDPTFDQEPLPVSAMQTQIEQWEPRAQVLINSAPSKFDVSVVNAQVNVQRQGNS
jgi:phage baseplate assembly protein W